MVRRRGHVDTNPGKEPKRKRLKPSITEEEDSTATGEDEFVFNENDTSEMEFQENGNASGHDDLPGPSKFAAAAKKKSKSSEKKSSPIRPPPPSSSVDSSPPGPSKERGSETDDDLGSTPVSAPSPVREEEEAGPSSPRFNPRRPQPPVSNRSSGAETEDQVPPLNNLDVSLDSETGEPRQGKEIADLLEVDIPPLPKLVMERDGSGQRLMISKIVNENFKSYYGRHEIGPFHKNFTSIVGPNGSGKSNVIDSLLFVFGYRAQRIRSKKVSVLIHNSEGHENVRSCTVEIHFQLIIDKPNNEYEIVPGSGFHVSRTAFSDNSSFYQLNGKRMVFKDVAKKLGEVGIDLVHNRFLILQGEVEQIALMKPKAVNEGDEGMLEYLEDIIGSSRLKNPIEQLAAKVEELGELRTEKLNRVKAAEGEKDELEGPKNEAIAFLEEENKLTRSKSRLFQLYLKETRDNKKVAETEYQAVKQEYEEKRKELEAVKTQVNDLDKTVKKMKKQAEGKQADSDKKKAEYNEYEKLDVKAQADIKNKKTKIAQAEKGMASEQKKLEQLRQQPEKSEKEVKEHKEIVERCEKKLEELGERLEEGMRDVGKETQPHLERKQTKEEHLMDRKRAVNEAKAKADLAQNDLDMYMRTKNAEQNKLDKLRNKKATDEEKLKELQEKLESAERQIPAKQALVDELRGKIRNLEKDEQTLVQEVSNKRARATEARSSMQQARSKGKVLDTLLAAKNRGDIPGIFGRLGDLGAIDEKFDVAISTCCGPLDNIVVDTVDTATECVSLLKRTEAGMATFVALDKQEHLKAHMRRPFQAPRNAERLFDLIRVQDDAVLPAFYWALRDTLVTTTLDEATRIAYADPNHRKRVVTLKGELIEPSGTMSGGGKKQSRGRMGRRVQSPESVITPQQLAAMEESVTDASQRLIAVRKEKQESEDEVNKAEKLLAEIRPLRETTQRQMKALEQELKGAGKKIEEQARAVKAAAPDETETEAKREAVEEANKALEAVKKKAEVLDEEVKEIDDQINEITDRLVGLTKKGLESTKTEKKKAEKAIVQTSAASTKAQREIKKCEEKIESFEQEIAEAKEDIANLRKELDRITEEAALVCQDHIAFQKEAEEIMEGIEGVKEEKKAKEEEAQELEARDLELKTEVETKQESLREITRKGDHWNKELNKLNLHDLREFQTLKRRPRPAKKRGENDGGEEGMDDDVSQDGEGGFLSPREDEEGRVSDGEEEEEDAEDVITEEGKVVLRIYTEEEVEEKLRSGEWEKERLKFVLTTWEDTLKNKQGKPNLRVIEEFKRKELKYLARVKDLEDVSERRDLHRKKHEELKKMRMHEFMEGFGVISTRLKEMYQMITLGGDAELELVDTMDPFVEGIQFSVRPPKKSWKQISNLSGGEKTLSSLALVFALHHYKPTPLYVMDEIDAALDFKNVSIVANYIKERTKNGQFVIISLRNNMFELADRLVGIYKTFNCTKHVVINPEGVTLGLPDKRARFDKGRKETVIDPVA